MQIHGNTLGLRRGRIEEFEQRLDTIEIRRTDFAPVRLVNIMADLTRETNREVAAYIGRGGELIDVTVGESWHIALEEYHIRRSPDRLTGVRCLHTHPGGDATLSPADLQSLNKLKFDAMAAIGITETAITTISAAFLAGREAPPTVLPPVDFRYLPQAAWMQEILAAEARFEADAPKIAEEPERAFLVGLGEPYETNESLRELGALAETAGVIVLGGAAQNRAKMDASTYIGKGKAEELMYTIQGLACDLVIVDDEVSTSQRRALEEILGRRVIDRTMLILDIFAQRATSHEGKLQVMLAQLKYQMTHLIGSGGVMSRMRLGVGMRGPGETKLEVDRRRIRARITELEREIAQLRKQRDVRRSRRVQNEVPVVALVGYTNAGKSSLLNRLSGADVLAEDKLFATLDPVTRRVQLPDGPDFLLVDTVGFINKLPHQLVDAFRSTLEEVAYADLLLTISDASAPALELQRNVVDEVLRELGAGDIPRIEVLNKCDLPEAAGRNNAIRVSAATGMGIADLLTAIRHGLAHLSQRVEMLIPYESGQALGYVHQNGKVLHEAYEDRGVRIVAVMDRQVEERARRMLEQTAYV